MGPGDSLTHERLAQVFSAAMSSFAGRGFDQATWLGMRDIMYTMEHQHAALFQAMDVQCVMYEFGNLNIHCGRMDYYDRRGMAVYTRDKQGNNRRGRDEEVWSNRGRGNRANW